MARRARYEIEVDDRRAQPAIRRLQSGFSGVARVARSMRVPVAAAAAGVLGLGEVARRAANELDDLSKRADDAATSAADIAELDFAAALAGTEPERVARGLERLDRLIADAARGDARAVDIFDRLGLDAAALGRIDDVTDRLAALADALARIGDARERSALRQEVLGRGLGRFVAQGGAGIRAGVARAQALGLTDDLDAQARDAVTVVDAFTELGAVLSDRRRDLAALVLGSETLANSIRILTNSLAGQPIEAGPERSPFGPFIPGLQLPVGASNAPKESTQQEQLQILAQINRTLAASGGARYTR